MTLTILGPDDPALVALEEACARRPDLDAVVNIIPWADYRDTLMATLQADTSAYGAVCVPGHIWLPELADAGYLAPLTDLRSDIDTATLTGYDEAGLVASVKAESDYLGNWYMLPLFTDGHILFYRSDLLTLPENINLRDLPGYLRDLDLPAGISPFALKAHPSEILLDWLPYLWEFGGDLLDETGAPVFNQPAGVQALTFYLSLRDLAPANAHEYGNGEIMNALTNGEVAAAVSWGGQAAAIFNPDANANHTTMKTSGLTHSWNATWGVCLPANQPRAQAVDAFSRLLTLIDTETDQAVTRIAGSPVRRASYNAAEKARYPWLAAQQTMLQTCRTLPIDPALGGLLGILYGAVYRAFTGEVSPQQALDDAAAAIQA